MADKRTALLDAAEAVLVEQGLVGATVDQITARAGVAKGTFYLYFRSKDEVVGALQERMWDGMVAASVEAAERLGGDDDWWAVIDGFIDTVVEYDVEHRDWHRLIAQGWSSPGPEIAKREQQMIDIFTAGIQMGVEEGKFDVPDVEMTATMLYRACEGTMHQFCVADEPIDSARIAAGQKWLLRQVLRPAE